MLARRTTRIVASDRRFLLLILLSAPLLGALMLIRLPPDQLAALPPTRIRLVSQAPFVILAISLAVTQLGATNSVREIVKELPIFRRERAVGLKISAYLAAKLTVFGTVTAAQAIVVTLLAVARQGGPEDAVVLGSGALEVAVAMAATGVAAVALGLLVSSLVSSTDQAMTFLPVIVIMQLILTAGGVFPALNDPPGIQQAAYLSSAQWGFSAAASTTEMNHLNAMNTLAAQVPVIDLSETQRIVSAALSDPRGESRWNHDFATWMGIISALALLTLATTSLAALGLRRHDPS